MLEVSVDRSIFEDVLSELPTEEQTILYLHFKGIGRKRFNKYTGASPGIFSRRAMLIYGKLALLVFYRSNKNYLDQSMDFLLKGCTKSKKLFYNVLENPTRRAKDVGAEFGLSESHMRSLMFKILNHKINKGCSKTRFFATLIGKVLWGQLRRRRVLTDVFDEGFIVDFIPEDAEIEFLEEEPLRSPVLWDENPVRYPILNEFRSEYFKVSGT